MFPAPIGGFVLPSDFAPSIVFAVLYALLLPLVIYRAVNRRSRTVLLIGTCIFSVERIVIFSLRALQSRRLGSALSTGLMKYMQASFGVGYIGLANDLVSLTRCLLVNPTFGPEIWNESPASRTKESLFEEPKPGEEDHPKERAFCRRFTGITNLAFIAATIPGGIAGGNFNKINWDNQAKATQTFNLRYESTALALVLMIIVVLGANWSRKHQARACHRAINIICVITLLTATTGVYRLAVMGHESPAPDSTLPGTLTSPGAKASFYILHILPEWIAAAILLGFNTRKTFGTGPFGDVRRSDDGPEEKAKWEKRRAEHDAKKAKKAAEKNNASVTVLEV